MEKIQNGKNTTGEAMASAQPLELRSDEETINTNEYADAYGENLSQTLSLDTWHSGDELLELYVRLEAEVQKAIQQEDETREGIRKKIFPLLRNREGRSIRCRSLPNYH